MYEILFYEDRKGNAPIFEYIEKLSKKSDKNSRINHNKINDYLEALSKYGKTIGEPFIKHLDGEIWELRPIRNRIFFASWSDGKFILLHHFIKKTQKTPAHEIEQAKRNLYDMHERRKEK